MHYQNWDPFYFQHTRWGPKNVMVQVVTPTAVTIYEALPSKYFYLKYAKQHLNGLGKSSALF